MPRLRVVLAWGALPQLRDERAEGLHPGFRAVLPGPLRRELDWQVAAPRSNRLEVWIAEGAGDEGLPVVPSARAVQECFQRVGHVRSGRVGRPARQPDEKGNERDKSGEEEESYDAHLEVAT